MEAKSPGRNWIQAVQCDEFANTYSINPQTFPQIHSIEKQIVKTTNSATFPIEILVLSYIGDDKTRGS